MRRTSNSPKAELCFNSDTAAFLEFNGSMTTIEKEQTSVEDTRYAKYLLQRQVWKLATTQVAVAPQLGG